MALPGHIGTMIDLALKSVRHDWRRYLPVAVAIGISGLLMVMQLAFAMGAFSTAAAPIGLSRAQIWVGPATATSLDESAGIGAAQASALWMVQGVERIEPYQTSFAEVSRERKVGQAEESPRYGLIVGLDVRPGAALYAGVVSGAARRALAEPDTAVIDRSLAADLGLRLGDRVSVSKRTLRIVGIKRGLRGMGMTSVLVSEPTARSLAGSATSDPAFYLLTLADPRDAAQVQAELDRGRVASELRAWNADDLRNSTIRTWALGSGAGTIFLASTGIALTVTLLIVNQTLGAAVAATMREYAALRAYGLSFGRVQRIVMRQGLWVGLGAMALTGLLAAILLIVLRMRDVAVVMTPIMAAGTALALLVVVILSNLMALRRLRHADPASLLR
ncbi:ABC transporter permease [Paracoccus sp. p4-l81]|uniref:ABC transporter permease n=1 Tax=Paracoccus sp. p4-l81 TaxID=3342806 RepID=UPI0035BB9827